MNRLMRQAGARKGSPARLAAILLAALVASSCTSSDGMTPPAAVGSTSSAAAVPAAETSTTATLTAASPALTSADGSAEAPVAAAPPAETAAPAYSGPQPSSDAAPDSGPVAAVVSSSSIRFAPITGATREAAAPLSEHLLARARQRGIALAGAGMQPTYVLKGYFSEVSDGGATTVIYVWDVTDPAGKRLHRIQGQAKSEGAAVSVRTMQAIADRTIDELAQWLSARTG